MNSGLCHEMMNYSGMSLVSFADCSPLCCIVPGCHTICVKILDDLGYVCVVCFSFDALTPTFLASVFLLQESYIGSFGL